MINGNELDQRAREIAKLMSEADVNDIALNRELLKRAEQVRKDYSQWIEENSRA